MGADPYLQNLLRPVFLGRYLKGRISHSGRGCSAMAFPVREMMKLIITRSLMRLSLRTLKASRFLLAVLLFRRLGTSWSWKDESKRSLGMTKISPPWGISKTGMLMESMQNFLSALTTTRLLSHATFIRSITPQRLAAADIRALSNGRIVKEL